MSVTLHLPRVDGLIFPSHSSLRFGVLGMFLGFKYLLTFGVWKPWVLPIFVWVS